MPAKKTAAIEAASGEVTATPTNRSSSRARTTTTNQRTRKEEDSAKKHAELEKRSKAEELKREQINVFYEDHLKGKEMTGWNSKDQVLAENLFVWNCIMVIFYL